jgi:hypothetical protein
MANEKIRNGLAEGGVEVFYFIMKIGKTTLICKLINYILVLSHPNSMAPKR